MLLVESAFFQCSPRSLDPQLRDWYTVSTQILREEIFLLCSILCFQNGFSRPLPLNHMASSSGPLGGPRSADAGGSPGGSAGEAEPRQGVFDSPGGKAVRAFL